MSDRRPLNWIALFSTNFLGIFNDNFLKNSIIFFTATWHIPAWISQAQLVSIVSAALILPYLLLSPYAGYVAMHRSKVRIMRFFKLLEMPIMMLASVAFIYEQLFLAILAVLFMGIQSCMFSPAKYSLVRDIGGEHRVAFGSGWLETTAFLAILSATILASYLSERTVSLVLSVIFVLIAIAGYIAVLQLKVTELPVIKHHHSLHPIRFLLHSYKLAKAYKHVNAAVMGSSLFWLFGALLQMNLVIHSTNVYQSANSATGLVLSSAALGIALGCIVAAKIAGKGTGKQFVVPALAMMGFLLFLLAYVDLSVESYFVTVFAFAFTGGFFQVPNLAIIQQSDSGRKLSDLFAYLNLTTFVFVLLGTVMFSISMHLSNDNSHLMFTLLMLLVFVSCIAYFVYFKIKR